ncbi:MAG: hypothetical protein KF763_18785 [Cyclobacteriaceae bacterium]|nr:hypothetical protein [Cyclobacteriaceae bacterium]
MLRLVLCSIFGISTGICQNLIPISDKVYGQSPQGQWTLDWSANDLLATGGDDSLVRIYKAINHELIKVYRMNGMIRQVRWHPNEPLLLITGVTLSILNIETNQTFPLQNIKYGARAVGWSNDGKHIAAADGVGTLHVWNREGVKVNMFPGNSQKSYLSLDWHPQKKLLLTGGDDIRIFHSEGGLQRAIKHRIESTGVLVVRWHPSGKFFVSGDYGHHDEGIESLIQFWSLDGKLLKIIRASKKEYRTLAWSYDGKLLATAGDALRIWNESGELIFEDKSGTSNDSWGMAWNRINTKLACIDFDGNLKIWSAKDWKLLDDK